MQRGDKFRLSLGSKFGTKVERSPAVFVVCVHVCVFCGNENQVGRRNLLPSLASRAACLQCNRNTHTHQLQHEFSTVVCAVIFKVDYWSAVRSARRVVSVTTIGFYYRIYTQGLLQFEAQYVYVYTMLRP